MVNGQGRGASPNSDFSPKSKYFGMWKYLYVGRASARLPPSFHFHTGTYIPRLASFLWSWMAPLLPFLSFLPIAPHCSPMAQGVGLPSRLSRHVVTTPHIRPSRVFAGMHGRKRGWEIATVLCLIIT